MAFLRCFVVPNVLVETDCDLPALARSRAIASMSTASLRVDGVIATDIYQHSLLIGISSIP